MLPPTFAADALCRVLSNSDKTAASAVGISVVVLVFAFFPAAASKREWRQGMTNHVDRLSMSRTAFLPVPIGEAAAAPTGVS